MYGGNLSNEEFLVREHLLRYVNGQIPIDNLLEWFYAKTWESNLSIVGAVKLWLAEDDVRTEEELKMNIRKLLKGINEH